MIRWLLAPLLRALLRVRIEGRLGTGAGPMLFVANHPALLDSLLLSVLLPADIVVLPREDRGAPWLRLALRGLPHLAADVGNPAMLRKLVRLLAAGKSVVIFPEGQVNPTRCVAKIYDVPALAASKAGTTVIPVWIRYGPGRLPRVHIRLLAPATIPASGQSLSRARRAHAVCELRRLMQAAAFEDRPRTTLFAAFLDALEQQGRHAPIIEDLTEQPRTYHDLLQGSLAIGRWSLRHTQFGDNVGVLLPNTIPSVCAVLGLTAFGRVPAMLNYTAGAAAVQSACIAARVRVVLTSRSFIEQARLTCVVAAISDRRLLYLEDLRGQLRLLDKLWLKAYALWWPRRAITPGRSEGPGVVLFTSGSEARPKGVVLSHEAVLANIVQVASVIDFSPRDKVLNPLPIYHSYGFTAGLMLCLVTGTQLFLAVSPLRYREIPEIAYRHGCTFVCGTSTFLSYYAKNANPQDFRSIRYVISGGEKLGADVARVWQEKFGLRIYQGYGATECAPVVSLSAPYCFRTGTVGGLLPRLEWRIQKVPGIERGGVLHLRGVQVMLGYYLRDNPGVLVPPRSIYGEGWYNTGDVVDMDRDGVLTVVGRVKRFAKVAGEMVSLDMIEEVAREASPQHAHAVVVRTEAASGEIVVLFTSDPNLDRPAMVRAARHLGRPDFGVAKRVVWTPEIPLLYTGKTDYVALETLSDAANAPEMEAPPAEHRPTPRSGTT
ncbi:MAG TPA: AMP-binding protein [Burkholderiales bacterium]|nr:AMP-binding protein [Burkholderiales bacterium]